MNTTLFIAKRYLFTRKKRNAINIISGIAVLAFTVCTAALIIILSTMNGFERLFFSMYSRFNPDFKITPVTGKVFEQSALEAKIKSLNGTAYIWPVLEDNAAIRNGDYQSVCTVKGVDSAYFRSNGLNALITQGEGVVKENNINYMVLGAIINQKINGNIDGPFSALSLISPKRGDYSANDPEAVKMLQIQPSGVVTIDESISTRYVFVPLDFARELFDRDKMVSSLEVRMKAGIDAEKFEENLRQTVGAGFKVQNRMQQQASLYKMFKSEKWASYAILTFILLIAAFNALGSLTMLVIEKKDDIATLSGMGADKTMIKRIYFTNGFLISGLGAIIGLCIGVALVLLQEKYGMIKMQGAIVDSYPVHLMINDVLLVAATAIGLGLVTGIYPAMKSVKDLN